MSAIGETSRGYRTGDELPELWRNSYFIDALKNVTRQLGPTR